MITNIEITQKALNKESAYRKAIIKGENLFPWIIKCNKKEFGDFILDKSAYIKLIKKSKNNIGIGYKIITNKDENPNSKATTKITKILVENQEDFLYLTDKTKQAEIFKKNVKKFLITFKDYQIKEYLLKNNKAIFDSTQKFIDSFILLTNFLLNNPNSLLYPREIPLPIDTKFLEKNLEKVIGFISFFKSLDEIEDRYQKLGLLNPSLMILLRSGTPFKISNNSNECLYSSIISLEPSKLKNFKIEVDNIYIVENKTTLFTFPLKDKDLCIYSGGFSILALKDIPFLKQGKLIYFGDLDEHGFAILSKFRELYPSVKSICMDKKTILDNSEFVIPGESYSGINFNLKSIEREALDYLIENKTDNKSSRIEQERLSSTYIKSRINKNFI